VNAYNQAIDSRRLLQEDVVPLAPNGTVCTPSCQNGGVCVQDSLITNQYVCDCTSTAFKGVDCTEPMGTTATPSPTTATPAGTTPSPTPASGPLVIDVKPLPTATESSHLSGTYPHARRRDPAPLLSWATYMCKSSGIHPLCGLTLAHSLVDFLPL
jgi:hypothetical protein